MLFFVSKIQLRITHEALDHGGGSGDHFFLTFLYNEGKNTHFSVNEQILEQ
jgi:hypothetical protein